MNSAGQGPSCAQQTMRALCGCTDTDAFIVPAGLPEMTGKLSKSRWNIGPGAEQVGQGH